MRVLGVNSVFHDPAAALVVDGVVVAALDCFGSAPVDALAIGPFLARRR